MDEKKKSGAAAGAAGVVAVGIGAAICGLIRKGASHAGELVSHVFAKEEPAMIHKVESKAVGDEIESGIGRFSSRAIPAPAAPTPRYRLTPYRGIAGNFFDVATYTLSRAVLTEPRIVRLENRLSEHLYHELHTRWERNRDELKAVQANPSDQSRLKAAQAEELAIEKQVDDFERQYG